MDISVKLNNFIRCIPLPGVLYYSTVTKTEFGNGVLDIHLSRKNTCGGEEADSDPA